MSHEAEIYKIVHKTYDKNGKKEDRISYHIEFTTNGQLTSMIYVDPTDNILKLIQYINTLEETVIRFTMPMSPNMDYDVLADNIVKMFMCHDTITQDNVLSLNNIRVCGIPFLVIKEK